MYNVYLRSEVSIQAGPPHDQPAEDEGDAQQGEQTATCGALVTRGGRSQLGILHTHARTHTHSEIDISVKIQSCRVIDLYL